jgi:filamentous hemagglutinin family protein
MKRTLLKHTLLAASLASIGFAAMAQNLPVGGTVSRGIGFNFTNGNTMTVYQYSDVLATNWQSFNIGAGYRVKFDQPSAQAIALNRVTGTTASTINGQLQANGQVFLINPNGILFGKTAQVNVGGLVATTLNIADSAVTTSGTMEFTFAGSNGTVRNEGVINASGTNGSVVLSALSLSNNGKITVDGNVSLVGTTDMTLSNSLNDGMIGRIKEYFYGGGFVNNDVGGGGVIQNLGGTLNAPVIKLTSERTIVNTGAIKAKQLYMTTTNEYSYGEVINDGSANIAADNYTVRTDAFTNVGNAQINVKDFNATIHRRDFSNYGIINVNNDFAFKGNVGNFSMDTRSFKNYNSIAVGNKLSIEAITIENMGNSSRISAGNIAMSTNDLVNQGGIRASSWNGNIDIQAARNVNNQGSISATQKAALTAGNVNNSAGASILANDVSINAASTIRNGGVIGLTGRAIASSVVLNAGDSIFNEASGHIGSNSQRTRLRAGAALINFGTIGAGGGQTMVSAGNFVYNAGRILGGVAEVGGGKGSLNVLGSSSFSK